MIPLPFRDQEEPGLFLENEVNPTLYIITLQ